MSATQEAANVLAALDPSWTLQPLSLPASDTTASLPSPSQAESGFQNGKSEYGEKRYITGVPLLLTTAALSLAVFLASLEVSIVATSLISITDDLKGFDRASWIITSYLLTYTGFLIIWGKCSDIFGRKLLVVSSLVLFMVFSAACGASATTNQLIIFRAMQGIGGAGTYSLVFVIFFEMVPAEKFAPYTSILSIVFALALLLGPLLGGVICNNASWRWIFYINLPAGAVSAIMLFLTIPRNFPYHGLPASSPLRISVKERFSARQWARVDLVGTVLLLVATVFLVTILEETNIRFSWGSGIIIAFLILSVTAWIAFFAWSRFITRQDGRREPIFPWRFLQSRIPVGLFLSMFLTGAPFTVAVIQIPLKFQIVYRLSPVNAGIRLLPFAILSPVGSGLAAGLAGKRKIPPIYLSFFGSLLQTVGFTLLSTKSGISHIDSAEYGYEAIAGFAVGINLACLILMTPFTVQERDKPVAMSAIIQFRTMGGTIGLSIVTAAMNAYVKDHLSSRFSPIQIATLLRTTQAFRDLSPQNSDFARAVFAQGYCLQQKIMVGFSVAQIPATLLLWKKEQILI